MTGRPLILVVIDGLTPEVFEQAVERGTAATLASLHGAGSYGRAASTFPSLTPVCTPLLRPHRRRWRLAL